LSGAAQLVVVLTSALGRSRAVGRLDPRRATTISSFSGKWWLSATPLEAVGMADQGSGMEERKKSQCFSNAKLGSL
jgi:hypothetical protein